MDPDGNVQVLRTPLDNTTLNRCVERLKNPACRLSRSSLYRGCALGHEDFCYLHNHILPTVVTRWP